MLTVKNDTFTDVFIAYDTHTGVLLTHEGDRRGNPLPKGMTYNNKDLEHDTDLSIVNCDNCHVVKLDIDCVKLKENMVCPPCAQMMINYMGNAPG